MFGLTQSDSFSLYAKPTDMRNGFCGLSGIVSNKLDRDPTNGEVFIFINKQRDKVKLLKWFGNGFTLYYKRLERGRFELPNYDLEKGEIVLTYAQLVMIIDGISIKNIEQRRRF